MSHLIFRYRYDESFFDHRQTRDDFGRLTLSVVTDSFSGTGGFWVQWQDVRRFGDRLSRFPITSDEPVAENWGGTIDDVYCLALGVEIAPANKTGDLRVKVEIADEADPERRVCTWFLTNYPDLDAFRRSIANLMDRKVDEAILRGGG